MKIKNEDSSFDLSKLGRTLSKEELKKIIGGVQECKFDIDCQGMPPAHCCIYAHPGDLWGRCQNCP